MLPFSRVSTSWGRFASNVRASASDFRLALAAKLDDRRLSRGTQREQRSEISIRGHDDSMLGGSALKITSSSACLNRNSRTWIAS